MADKEEVVIPSKAELLGKIDDQEEIVEGDGEEGGEEVELSPREQDAVTQGWQTEKDWVASGKDAKTWRPAEQWLDRGAFFKKIGELNSELASTKAQVSEAFKTGQRIAEANFKAEIDELKAQRRVAQQEGDFETADKIDEKIDEKKEQFKQPTVKTPTNLAPPPEYDLFLDRNPWYNTDSVLHFAADGLGYEYKRLNPQAKPADLYWFVEQKMKEKFPELGGKQKETAKLPPSPDSAANNRGSAPAKGSMSEARRNMDEMEVSIMKTLIKNGDFKSEEDYLKQYAATPSRRR